MARDFKDKGCRGESLFAVTPPSDALKSMLASSFRADLIVIVIDVKKVGLSGVVNLGERK